MVYENLGLVITDEQHRFGVKQREALTTRGNAPHVLVMSATPIPRTLAIIVYGDLDISIIDELPAMRLPIKNCVVGTSYRPKAYSFIERQVREGRQAYVICPMVEESEGQTGKRDGLYSTAERDFPSDITIGMLHGKMKPKEKNGIMEQFARGEIQVLVSTTVVEVGVNVPNATVMMVSHAMEEVARVTDRLLVMDHGGLRMDNSPREVFRHAWELQQIGLAIPQVTRVFLRLRELGVPVDSSVYTVEQAARELLRLKGGKGSC